MKVLLPFINLFRTGHRWILLGILLAVLCLAAGAGLLALSGWFLSAAAMAGLSVAAAGSFNFFSPSAGLRSFAVIRTVARYLERIVSHDTTLRLLKSLRIWFYRQIEPLSPAGLLRHRSGDLLSRIVADIDTLDFLYIRLLSPTAAAFFLIVLAVAFLWWLAPAIAMAVLGFFVIAGVVLPVVVCRAGRQLGLKMQQQLARLRTTVVEDVQGMADLMVYGADERHRQRLLEESERLLAQQERMARVSGFSTAMMTILTGLAAVVALYIAIPLTQTGSFDGAMLALIAFGVLAAFEAVLPLPLAFQFLGKISEAANRILEVTQESPAVTFYAESLSFPNTIDIEFHQVSFGYPDSPAPALENLSLVVPQNAKVGIVGPSGSGKTTLAHLLARFWDPLQGCIRIGGLDLRRLSELQLRDAVTLVSQRSHIFCDTFRYNLLVANPLATDEQLWQALERAQLAEFTKALPQGLDTWTGEGGSRLSGGQARRLVLARALLKNSPIWILDEPTEGLDNDTRQQFMQALFAAMEGKTVLLITHETRDLEFLDCVYFIENGRIAASGRHAQLLRKSDRYRLFVGEKEAVGG